MKEKLEIKPFFRDKENPLPPGEHSGFVERLLELREEYGISQESLSRKVGLSKSTYGTYESEKALPDAETVRNLAKYYCVSSDYLLGLSEEREKEPEYIDEDNDSLTMQQFSYECRQSFADVLYETPVKNVFEDLVQEKSFVEFLKYVYTYVKYSAEVETELIKVLKNRHLYDSVFSVDTTNSSLAKTGNITDAVSITEVYYSKLHKTLDKMLKNLAKKPEYISDLKKVIRDISSDEEYMG